MGFTTYTVKPGKANFRPLENPLPVFNPKGFEIVFKFLPGGWCSKDDYSFIDDNSKSVLDKDRDDLQKIKGITHFFSANNKRTAMFAFSFGDQPETYKLFAYTNDKKGNFKWSRPIIVESNEVVAGTCEFVDGKAVYNLATEGGLYLNESHDFKSFKIGREVGTYAGGANNSPGPFGGKAVKELSIDIDFNITK